MELPSRVTRGAPPRPCGWRSLSQDLLILKGHHERRFVSCRFCRCGRPGGGSRYFWVPSAVEGNSNGAVRVQRQFAGLALGPRSGNGGQHRLRCVGGRGSRGGLGSQSSGVPWSQLETTLSLRTGLGIATEQRVCGDAARVRGGQWQLSDDFEPGTKQAPHNPQ